MDVDNRPPPLPAKLRWRPYANGNSLKSKNKPKKEDAPKQKQAPNPKAVASKMRGAQYYTGKTRTVEVQLQWEEAETIQSMSNGGHPHNHHHPHHPEQQHPQQGSRDSSPSASSVSSSSSSSDGQSKSRNNSSDSNSSGVFASIQRAMSSLPSPPSSQQPLTTRLDLVGGQSDFSLFRATIPGLNDSGFLNSSLPMDAASSNNAYQITLNALFQSQNFKNPTAYQTPALFNSTDNTTNAPPLTHNNHNNNNNSNNNGASSVPSSAALLGASNINHALLSDPNRMLSGQELLSIASIDELLNSCGFVDSATNPLNAPQSHLSAQILPSPANSNQSLESSPLASLLDLDGNNAGFVRSVSPCSNSFSPMALTNNSFEALLAQSVPPGQATQTASTATGTNNAYTELLQELASPFDYLATDVNMSNSPAAWPSLFATATTSNNNNINTASAAAATVKDQGLNAVETLAVASVPGPAPQRMEIATQTDGPYSPISGTSSTRGSTHGSPSLASSLGLSDEELDPDWLNFLDEASPLFTDIDMPSPPPSGDEGPASLPSSPSKSSSRDRSMWNWAEELLKPGVKTPTGTRGGFPTSQSGYPSMTNVPSGGQIGGGGLVRTLQGTNQQRSVKSSTNAATSSDKDVAANESPREGQSAKTTSSGPTSTTQSAIPPMEPKEDNQFGGLMAMIRGLWAMSYYFGSPSTTPVSSVKTGTNVAEEFALNPEKRQELIDTIPTGTKEYYLYRLRQVSINLQDPSKEITAGRMFEAMSILKMAESSLMFRDSNETLEQFRAQFALLGYKIQPDQFLKQLPFNKSSVTQLDSPFGPPTAGFQFTLAQPTTNTDGRPSQPLATGGLSDIRESLSSTMDPSMISTDFLVQQLLLDIERKPYDTRVPQQAWPFLMAKRETETTLMRLTTDALLSVFKTIQLSISSKSLDVMEHFSDRDRAQVDSIVTKVILRLVEALKLNFGDGLTQFQYLTNTQLGMLRKAKPDLMNNEGFVGLLEKRIFPRPSIDFHVKEAEEVHKEWLDRMLIFVDQLSAKFNRHKLSVYLMSLEYDLKKKIMNKDKFMKYVAIPRTHTFYKEERLGAIAPKSGLFERDVNIVNMMNPAALHHWSTRVKLVTKVRDDDIVDEYLTYFVTQARSAKDFEGFFSVKDFLNPLLAKAMLTSGDKDVTTWSKLLNTAGNLTTLTEQTMVKFARGNPATFLPEDPVVFRLKVKNAKRVIVRVFEVKTLEYLQQHEGVVGKNLNLEGLSANWEHTLSFDFPAIEIHEVSIDLPELANRRGAFVMDVICNGENSMAYFTKGYLDYIERQSVAGHVLTIIDEHQKKITEDVGVWYNGYFYKTNENGDIIIPYKSPSGGNGANEVFITHNDFTTRRPFAHYREYYDMALSCHLDHESLVAGSAAKLLIKPHVTIAGRQVTCPVELLERVVLQIVSIDTSDTESTKTVLDFKVFDHDLSVYSFQVPENLREIEISLSGRIKILATGEYQELQQSKNVTIDSNGSDQVVSVQFKDRKQQVQLHGEILTMLRKTSAGYEVHVMGKNGEKRPGIPMEFTFDHPIWTKDLCKYLISDANGIIRLGDLTDIDTVTCNLNSNKWSLVETNHRDDLPSNIQSIAGDPIYLSVSRQDLCFVHNITLFKRSTESSGANWCLVDDYTGHIRLQDGLLTIKDLIPGYYTLKISPEQSIEITVANVKASESRIAGLDDYHLGVNPMLEVPDSAKHPLHMPPAFANDSTETVEIQVRNWTEATRVCILATRYLPHTPMFENLFVCDTLVPWQKLKATQTLTTYSTGRVLGEEYQYILNRKAQTNHWAGNLLSKPSVLLTPWSVGDTTMSQQHMAQTDSSRLVSNVESAYGAAVAGAGGQGLGRGGAQRHRRILPPGLPPLLTFASHPSVILVNLIPDQATGRLIVPYAEFKECSFLQIYVTDADQALQQSLSISRLAEMPLQRRDLRFKSPLDHTKHYIGERSGSNLDPKFEAAVQAEDGSFEAKSIMLSSTGSSSSAIRVINAVSQVYDLMMTLIEGSAIHKQNLKKFGFVTDWHRLSAVEKNEKFSKWNCHELNLFLYKKDRPYFDKVVQSFIKNKLIKSFVDDYLIGADLEKYTTLTEFNKLTCMEKCLLAQRLPRVRPSVSKWIKNRLRNPKVASDVKLFRTVMQSGNAEEIPSSPAYSPTSPSYSPTSPAYAAPQPSSNSLLNQLESAEQADDFEMVERSAYQPMSMSFSAASPPIFPAAPAGGFGGFGSAAPVQQQSRGGGLFGSTSASAAPAAAFGGFGSAAPAHTQSRGGGLFGSTSSSAAPAFGASFSSAPSPFSSPAPPPPPPSGFGSSAFGSTNSNSALSPMSFGSARLPTTSTPTVPTTARQQSQQLHQQQFKPVDLTKEMAETYYWDRQDHEGTKESKDVNAFWMDFAEWDEAKGGSFLSQNFVVNTASFTDVMATLALLDVSFKPKDASIRRSVDRNLIISSTSPAIVFHSSTKELTQTPITGAILATQQYFKKLEKTVYNNKLATNVRSYVQPGAEFIPLESYGVHVVLMNATPNPMKLHLEVQLPQGAMPIGDIETSQDVELSAHGTYQDEYMFYFPEEGDFDHYPAHISDDEEIIAFANPTVLKVRVPVPGVFSAGYVVDTTTWNYVVNHGSNDQVLVKLGTDSLEGLPVELLIPRLYKDVGFLKNVTNVLRERHEYIDRIWSVCLALDYKEDRELGKLLKEYIEQQTVVDKVGPYFTSALLTKRPQNRYKHHDKSFHYLEYFPLINARTHKATRTAKILNDRFKLQFDRFLTLLSSQPSHGVGDLLVLIVYLLAQDRILEAKDKFVKLSELVQSEGLDQDPETKVFQQIQYDYLQCYLSLCVEVQQTSISSGNSGDDIGMDDSIESLILDLEGVLTILNKYRRYPVKRWNKLFKDMREYVDEILKDSLEAVGDASSADVEMKQAATMEEPEEEDQPARPSDSSAVTVDFKIATNSQIEIRHQGVREVIVEYYSIDAETMFSSSPLTFSDQGESVTNVASGAKSAGGNSTEATTSSNSYRLVKPNGVDKHTISLGSSSSSNHSLLTVPILERYLNTNVMISVSTVPAAATKSWRAYYSQSIDVLCNERSGTIRVSAKRHKNNQGQVTTVTSNSSTSTSRPIRGGYVKVYAEMKNGYRSTSFWKDGYTDLVGRFEYAQVSTGTANGGSLADVRRFVVFVDGGKEGCVVKTVPVPAV
ncbi:hypothetical protein BGZ83_005402 [Gryganskiella cystojenkinii]|nr:hypothetical protein BGZ83_005402 [Gryganskiella cystojenkinii]